MTRQERESNSELLWILIPIITLYLTKKRR